jgi:hypothetical protein
MSSLKPIPLTFRQILSESDFTKFRKTNRIYFYLLTGLVVMMTLSLFFSIKIGIDTSMATGAIALLYVILVSILAAKNKKIVILWTLGAVFTAPFAFLPIHIRLIFVGKKIEWL